MDYKLETDDNQWTLMKRVQHTGFNSKGKGKTVDWKPLRYYPTASTAFKGLFEFVLRDELTESDYNSLQTALKNAEERVMNYAKQFTS